MSNQKQTLLDIKRTTNITTEAIAKCAQLEVADVFTVEIGGYTSWAVAQKVVRAFNQLSGMQVRVDDIKFSPFTVISNQAHSTEGRSKQYTCSSELLNMLEKGSLRS